jgi:protein TonB
VTTDLPNFPYPWYISQVRLMLFREWQKRMPRLDAEGAVAFAILPNGGITDLSVESSSGDASFDRASLDSVQAAAPFPPLPSDFHEHFLKIHLSLKSEEAWR